LNNLVKISFNHFRNKIDTSPSERNISSKYHISCTKVISEKLDSEKLISPFPLTTTDSYSGGGCDTADNPGARRWAAAYENYEYGRHL